MCSVSVVAVFLDSIMHDNDNGIIVLNRNGMEKTIIIGHFFVLFV